MSEVVAYKADHLLSLSKERGNSELEDWFNSGLAFELEKTDAVTFIYKGKIQLCGGIRPYWTGRGQVWIVFSQSIKCNFIPSFRAIKRWIKHQIKNNYQRIELSVDENFPLGKRRAEMLGFKLEVERAEKYLPDGRNCSLYSMVRS